MSVQKRIGVRGTRWVAIVELPRDPRSPTRKQRKRTFPTRKAAERWEREMQVAFGRGIFREPSNEPLASYLARWLPSVDIAESTRKEYAGTIRRVINPELGDVPLGKLTGRHIQDLYNAVRGRTNAPVVQAIMRGVLKTAVREEQIPRNVAEGFTVGRSTREKPETQSWEPDELRTFLDAMQGHNLYAFFWTAAYTGMRASELANLRWDDVSFDLRRLFVTKSKSAAGRRIIALDAATLDVLRVHQAEQAERQAFLGSEWQGDNHVFDRGNGQPVVVHTAEYVMKQAVARLGLPPLTPHGLRHTHATTLLQAGVPVHVVQQRLGHASARTTLDVYAHAMPADQRTVAEVFAKAISGPISNAGDQTVTNFESAAEESASTQ